MITINNEAELGSFFKDKQNTLIMYHTEQNCKECEKLLPAFKKLALDPDHQNVGFGQMEAAPASEAERLINQRQLPFVASYKWGVLIECRMVTSEEDLRDMLKNLPTINLNV
ncbi:MAG TPA: hypothetical protein VK927_10195 [Adhaeribacter sp.]|nr:hypothetical protein [Adhaeribacter sp.]